MSNSPHVGTVQLATHRVLFHLAHNYSSAISALFELTDNALDSRDGPKVTIWIVIEDDRVTVIDNGSGMTGMLSPEELETIQRYKDLVAQGQLPPGYDVRDELTPKGKGSLQYLAESIGFSGKTDPAFIGRHGIGFWGWIMLAETVTVVTSVGGTHIHTFVPASREQIEQGILTYSITPGGVHATPWRGNLPRGTTVALQLRDEVKGAIPPGTLVTQLGARYSGFIHQGMLEIKVVDRVTTAGRKERGGLVLSVNPPKMFGSAILLRDYQVKSNGKLHPYSVNVRFIEGKHTGGIQVRILGIDRCAVHEIPGFEHLKGELSPQLTGYIELPSYIPLNTNKDRPQQGTALTKWINHVLAHAIPAILKETEQHERVLSDRRIVQYSRTTVEAVAQALKDIPHFDMPTFESAVVETARPHKPTTKRGAKNVRATVIDEHTRGVPGVKVTVAGEGYARTLETGTAGGVLFGELPFGKYSISIEVPEGATPINRTGYTFWLDAQKPGYGGIFTIFTGTNPPIDRKAQLQQIVFRPLPDPLRLWDISRLRVGIIVINSDAQPIADARDQSVKSGNWSRLDDIVAQCIASALAEYQYGAETHLALTMSTWLSAAIRAQLGKTRRK